MFRHRMDITINIAAFAYPKRPESVIFRDTTAAFSAGRVSVIVGKSGSGKSTLLKLLAGLIGHDTPWGSVSFGPRKLHSTDLARSGKLSLCFQKPACLPWATVRDNVTLASRLNGTRSDETAAAALLKQFGLESWSSSYPNMLSLGMQARVALARAFITRPAVVLLDEPFSSLDIEWKEQLYKYLLHALSQDQCTTIVVTHDLSEALALGDDIYYINTESGVIEPALQHNPLKQTSDQVSIRALVGNPRFAELFGRLYDLLAVQETN